MSWCNSMMTAARFSAGILLMLSFYAGCQEAKDDAPPGSGDADTEGPCPWDDDNEVGKATALALATPAKGFICPHDDEDWYQIAVPEGNDLLTVDLSVAEFASITPAFTIWTPDQSAVVAAPESSELATDQAPLSITYGMAAGNYALQVFDRGSGTDNYHAYTVLLTGAKDQDANEPNNAPGQATNGSGAITGYISFRGDEDWYRVTAPERGMVTVVMNMAAGGIQPAYRIEDASGNELVRRVNEAGTREPTAFDNIEFLGSSGTYYVIVSDDDLRDSDLSTPYTISLSGSSDPDTNEPNDEPANATDLTASGAITLGTDWEERPSSGFIASAGDVDWYHVDVDAGEGSRGVIEAAVNFNGNLPADMQADVRFMYGVSEKTCSEHHECDTLGIPCADNSDCAGFGKDCLPEGFCEDIYSCTTDVDCAMVGTTCDTITGYCAGANICIEGHCGAVLSHLEAPESNPRSVTLSAPLMNVSSLYVVVGDFQSDAYAPGTSYNVNVRVAEEPDTHEPSEFFSGIPPTEDDQMSAHHPFATVVTVHDCGTDCCEGNPANWVEGYLSYTYDQDWYSYEHPCPDADCMVAVHYELAAGPVDFLMMVYRNTEEFGSDVWVELDPPSDTGNSPAKSNKYGGTAAGDECFFAHSLHENYFFIVRDTVWVSESNPRGGLWDASKDQSYRFCIEKIADGCLSPCRTADDGSGCTLDP